MKNIYINGLEIMLNNPFRDPYHPLTELFVFGATSMVSLPCPSHHQVKKKKGGAKSIVG